MDEVRVEIREAGLRNTCTLLMFKKNIKVLWISGFKHWTEMRGLGVQTLAWDLCSQTRYFIYFASLQLGVKRTPVRV